MAKRKKKQQLKMQCDVIHTCTTISSRLKWNGAQACVCESVCVRVCLFMPVLAACTFPFGHLYIHSSFVLFCLGYLFVCIHIRLMGSAIIIERHKMNLTIALQKERSVRCACSYFFSFAQKINKIKNFIEIFSSIRIFF